jgi:hypothetical protein
MTEAQRQAYVYGVMEDARLGDMGRTICLAAALADRLGFDLCESEDGEFFWEPQETRGMDVTLA